MRLVVETIHMKDARLSWLKQPRQLRTWLTSRGRGSGLLLGGDLSLQGTELRLERRRILIVPGCMKRITIKAGTLSMRPPTAGLCVLERFPI